MDARTEAEFRQFVEARSLALLRTAYVLSGDQHHAEDLVQGALAKLATRWRKVDDPEACVRRVVYHDQVSWWRRRGRFREELVENAPDNSAGFAADHAGRVERRLDVRQALARLGPRQRAVLALRYFEDLPEAEVAPPSRPLRPPLSNRPPHRRSWSRRPRPLPRSPPSCRPAGPTVSTEPRPVEATATPTPATPTPATSTPAGPAAPGGLR